MFRPKALILFLTAFIFAAILAPFAGAQQIHELYNSGSKWTGQARNSGAANWFWGMAGFYTTPNDQFHVYYRVGGPGDDTDVHQLFYDGMNWSDQDLTTLAKSPRH